MKYSLIVDTYEKIEATTKRLEMRDLLANLFKKTPKSIISEVTYLTQGKLYPDYMGIEIGLAEKLIVRGLSLSSGKTEKTVDTAFRKKGDLGEVAATLLGKKAQQTLMSRTLSVRDVYRIFDKIAKSAGSGSIDIKLRFLSSLMNDASPREAKYIIRMALGKLRLGVADMTILEALASAFTGDVNNKDRLERAYNLSSDLGLIAKIVATSGIEGIKKIKVEIGRPIRPMLAERLSDPTEILEKLSGQAAVEYKYDGLRMQVHISPKSSSIFSRRLENITEQFPDVIKYVKKSMKPKEAIFEGECVAIDPITADLLPFQMISQRRGRKHDLQDMVEQIPVKVFLFDILYSNGIEYTRMPYQKRRMILTEAIKPNDWISLSEQIITTNTTEIEKFMNKAVSDGCEGLIMKSIDPNSTYRAGARGWVWIKYKRAYKSEMADTMDLVVVGGFYGRGKRGGSYGALLLAAYNQANGKFQTVCKCGSGFTDNDLKELLSKLKSSTLSQRSSQVDSKISADVWFNPYLVLEITGDEITLSPVHTTCENELRKNSGLAIRFPRFTGRYRLDKSPEDASTTKEILGMYNNQLKKISI
ncbi:MAG: ATP-dependent DNA ligase [Candidatus Bathyarchaeia archaeon]